jgi:hypothetical protein
MPKQRLADFRGGVGEKISSHMIGQTQGQSAQDVDLSSVRLQGRKKLDTSTVAGGSYYYETGLLAGGRFVSIHPADDTNDSDSPYIEYASDFVTWNLDLYVATGNPASDGTTYGDGRLIVYRDGSTESVVVDFRPPEVATATVAFQANTKLVNEIGEIPFSNTSTKVTSSNAGIAQWGSNKKSYSGPTHAVSHPGYYTWEREGLNAIYYTQGTSGDLMNRTGGGPGTDSETINLTTANGGTYGYAATSTSLVISGATYYVWSGGGNLCATTGWGSPVYHYTPGSDAYTDTDGPFYAANYKWRWTRTANPPTTVSENPRDYGVADLWAEQVIVHNTYLGLGITGAPSSIEDRLQIFYRNAYGNSDLYDGPMVTSFTGRDGLTVTKGPEYSRSSFDTEQYSSTPMTFWLLFTPPATGQQEITIWCDGDYKGSFNGAGADLSNTTDVVINGVRWYRGQFAEWGDNGARYHIKIPLVRVIYQINVNGTFTYPSTTGTREIIWNGATVQAQSNVSESDHSTSQAIGGYTYTASGSDRNTSDDVYEYSVQRSREIAAVAPTLGSQAQHTIPGTPPTYTYSGPVNDNVIQEASAGTDPFYYDDARLYRYRVITDSVLHWDEDPAKFASPGWLSTDRTFSLDDHGYRLYTVRNANGVAAKSQTFRQVTLSGTAAFGSGSLRTPQRLNFTVTPPNDDSSNPGQPLVCYMLERLDSLTTASNPMNLCYLLPDQSERFARSGNTITISGLSASTKYKLYWTGYSGTTATANSDAATKANSFGGYVFTTGVSQTTATVTVTPGDYTGIDFWLDREVMPDIFARVQCCEVFVGESLSIAHNCEFLDLYSESLGCSGLSGGGRAGVPGYLKFIVESNNFFFGVGTDRTEVERYGDADDRENKAGAFLFVSEYNNPREWPLDGYVEFEDEITCVHGYPGELLVWTRHGAYRVFGSRPEQMRKVKLATTEGMPIGNHTTATLVGRYLVWASQTGICIYDGASVANLTRPRLLSFPVSIAGAAGQFEGRYYLIKADETGWMVDFNLEGFPVTKLDLKEGSTGTQPHLSLIYRPQTNTLYSRRGLVEGLDQRNTWSYKTRGFDGNNFGSMKLVKTVTLNGIGSGYVQINLDGNPVYAGKGQQVSIAYEVGGITRMTQPVRLYLPASNENSPFGLAVCDVWDVEITDWEGAIDWIDTEYEILAGD